MDHFVVHQAVFGYQDGHRLLASSTKLPTDAARALQILTDRSGPSFEPSFDGYLTGTSLPDASVYALCRTWDAPEMPRPGCVFTHALLVEWADLSRLPDLRCLVDLFRRPSADDRSPYVVPIAFEPQFRGGGDWTAAQARALLDALYRDDERSLLLPANDRAQWESLVLAAWSQMWPRLRRTFRFSTGTLSLRGQIRQKFDLHVVPRSSIRRFQGEAEGRIWLDLADAPAPQPAIWCDVAAQDLEQAARSPLRAFLVQFGSDVEPRRSFFPSLVRSFLLHERGRRELARAPLDALLQEIGSEFPHPEDAGRLKKVLLGPEDPVDTRAERAIIEAIARAAAPEAFDVEDLDLDRRLVDLFQHDRPQALALTASLSEVDRLPRLGERLFARCATEVRAADLGTLEGQRAGTTAKLVERNWRLATAPAAWRCPLPTQRAILLRLADPDKARPRELPTQILSAAIEHGSPDLSEIAFRICEPEAIDSALSVAAKHPLPASWQNELRRHSDKVIELLLSSDRVMLGPALLCLSPMDAAVFRQPLDTWWTLLHRVTRNSSERDRIVTYAFVLAVALPRLDGADLCKHTFATVWTAAGHDELPSAAWLLIDSILASERGPGLSPSGKQRVLAQALVGAYRKHSWPRALFLQTLRSPALLSSVAGEVHGFFSPNALLVAIAHDVEARRIRPESGQEKIIENWRFYAPLAVPR